MIVYLKSLHIATLVLWCGGLFALPLMLASHDPLMSQTDYARARRYNHVAYTMLVTPAAMLAVVSGTWLIFLREIYEPWLFIKLVMVMLLVACHAWVGLMLQAVEDTAGQRSPPPARRVIGVLMVPMLTILLLVLAKPEIAISVLPQWLREPQRLDLPFAIPIW